MTKQQPTTTSAATDQTKRASGKEAARKRPVGPRRRQPEQAKILALLRRPKAATIVELRKATGWQPHSVRAAISRLRKSGITVERNIANGKSRYAAAHDAAGASA